MHFDYQPIKIKAARVQHAETPITQVVKTAFGVMKARHAVFLIVESTAGHVGVGESWINFPVWGHLNRVHDFEEAVVPFLIGREIADVPDTTGDLYHILKGPAIQSGTLGPLMQMLGAVELALWDCVGRAENRPLADILFEQRHEKIQVYASGINSPLPLDLIDQHLDRGVKLFKLKLGFGDEEDRANLTALKKHLGTNAQLAVDVNRGWSYEKAISWLPILAEHEIQWLEEPLTYKDEPLLPRLRALSPVPLAGAENIITPPDVEDNLLSEAPFDLIQPDLTKYTPLHVAHRWLSIAEGQGKRVIPHFLGSAPGQAASLQFAAGCQSGWVELDINRNRLRTDLHAEPFEIVDGCIAIPDRPGLGWNLKL